MTLSIFAVGGGPGAHQRRERAATAAPAGRAGAPARRPAPPPRRQRAAALHARAGGRPGPDRRLAQGHRPVRLADDLPRRPRGRRPAGGHRPRPVRRRDPGPREPDRDRHHRLGHRARGGRARQRGAHSIRGRSRSRARRSNPSRSWSCPCSSTARRSARSTSGAIGGAEAHFTPNEFELTKLFAGQASIAMQNAQTHREVRVRAEQDALTGLRNHGAFQRELGAAVEGGRPFARPDARPRRLQALQRRQRPSRRATGCWSRSPRR